MSWLDDGSMMISFCNLSLPQWSKIANNLIFNENFRWQTCKLLFRFNWGVFSSNNPAKADRQANQTRSGQPALCATPGWAKRKRPIGLQYPINELCRYTHTHMTKDTYWNNYPYSGYISICMRNPRLHPKYHCFRWLMAWA